MEIITRETICDWCNEKIMKGQKYISISVKVNLAGEELNAETKIINRIKGNYDSKAFFLKDSDFCDSDCLCNYIRENLKNNSLDS